MTLFRPFCRLFPAYFRIYRIARLGKGVAWCGEGVDRGIERESLIRKFFFENDSHLDP